MCGICGVYNFNSLGVNSNDLKLLNSEMILRGPDEEGYFLNNNFGMAMRRLSIIDIENGSQPMFSEDKNISLIFNGEIYNYIELRKELKLNGVKFKSNSDTEVLLKLYEINGESFVNKINGMFAICIFDKLKNKILVYRDRLGIKPLFFLKNEKNIVFSSNLNSIKSYLKSTEKSKLNFSLFLLLNYFPSNETVYENIQKLKPGEFIKIENNKFSINKYWEVNEIKKENLKKDEINYNIQKLIENSVKINLRSDVKVGTLLSGGIDSSIISYEASKYLKEQNTFCVNFKDKKNNEGDDAKKFSQFINSKHQNLDLEIADFFHTLAHISKISDEPHADSAIVPSYLISKEAKSKNVKVLISGAGGDEIFAGYSRHYSSFRNLFFGILSNIEFFDDKLITIFPYTIQNYLYKLKSKKIAHLSNMSGQNFGVVFSLIQNKEIKEFILNYFEKLFFRISDKIHNKHNFDNILTTDLENYLPDNILLSFDKMTMLNSVEGRVPFLDHRIVELLYGNNINVTLGQNFKNSKKILRNIYQKKLPNYIFKKNKIGFNAPLGDWKKYNQKFFNENFKINDFYCDIIDMKKLNKNIDNPNFNSFIYSLNVYDQWFKYH